MSDVVHFGEEPYAVRLMPLEGPDKEIGEVCPLLAVQAHQGLVVRDREMFWWPLNRMRVVLQPEPVPAEAAPEHIPAGLGGEGEGAEPSGDPPSD